MIRTPVFLLSVAIIISVTAYRYIVSSYPDRDLFHQVQRWLFNNAYDFYSGQVGGIYSAIGTSLEKGTRRKPGIKISNQPSAGGVENAINVASTTSAFGLVQEDSINEDDFIRNEMKYITPLYLEQVHILYRKKKYRKYVSDNSPSTVKLGLGSPVAEFFKNAVISSGSPHSGSSMVASRILNTLGVAPKQDLQISSRGALKRLMEDENSNEEGLDAVIWITGGPNGLIVDALKDRDVGGKQIESGIGIMGIDPTIAQLINEKYKSKLRPATFKDVYSNGEGIPTIGVYSFLICSNDVPSFAVMDLLKVLERVKPDVKDVMKHSSGIFQLDQFRFKEYYERNYHGFLKDLVKNVFIFLISIVVTTAGVMTFLVWIIPDSPG